MAKDNQRTFLLSFFSESGYQEKEVNGFWLVQHWNSDAKRWQVAVYTQESFERWKGFQVPTLGL